MSAYRSSYVMTASIDDEAEGPLSLYSERPAVAHAWSAPKIQDTLVAARTARGRPSPRGRGASAGCRWATLSIAVIAVAHSCSDSPRLNSAEAYGSSRMSAASLDFFAFS